MGHRMGYRWEREKKRFVSMGTGGRHAVCCCNYCTFCGGVVWAAGKGGHGTEPYRLSVCLSVCMMLWER